MSSFGSPPGKVEWRAVAGTSPKSRKPVPGRTSLGGGSPAQAAELPLWDRFPKVNMPFPGGSGLSIRRSNDPRRGLKGEITQYLAGMAAKRIFLRVSYIPLQGRHQDAASLTARSIPRQRASRPQKADSLVADGRRSAESARPDPAGQAFRGKQPGPRVRIDPTGLQAREEASTHRRASSARPARTRDFGVLPGKLVSWDCSANASRSIDERILKIRSPGIRSRSRRTPRPAARPVPGMPCGR